ncbi:lysophospholipase-like protein 1 isoform X1 [Osmia bicornis bicornis]|uniref:lysophospholipase-like protein 1 isoform X1 n=2 Tax=Osmia bicornis bicornis TaxID=1437191 RepID=UPI0010F59A71|nr:lysophospholipase-like protein 1 isoform X1 [Osmia bicornis bicornis]
MYKNYIHTFICFYLIVYGEAMNHITAINVVKATRRHSGTLFFFHGSGSSGDDIKKWIDTLNKGELNFPHIKIIYPTAPAQPYTPNNGTLSNVWYDRANISINAPEMVESVDSMCKTIQELINKEVSNGIPHDRIAVAGFSMGGGLSLYLSYKYISSLAGCCAMSSFINKNSMVYKHLKESPKIHTPLLQFHGNADAFIPIKWGEETSNNLKEFGVNVQFVPLNNVDHELDATEIKSFKEWLLNILPEN